MSVNLSEIISPAFSEIHKYVKNYAYTHYWLKGGRGSTKSSFVSIEFVLGIIRDPQANAIAFRKVGETLKDSVFSQIIWAIHILDLGEYFKISHSPMQITYIPTGQVILFRGLDKTQKLKSIKVRTGYIKYVWYEELDEFNGQEEIRNVNQSLLRGGSDFVVFYTYNPPKNTNSWVNSDSQLEKENRYVHHSTYLDVPRQWLGELFFIEAAHLKQNNEVAYRHEYLGEAVGNGGNIFTNVLNESLSDALIATFDNIRQGIDWGYAVDPFAFGKMHYDSTRKRLYIFDEIYKSGMLNASAIEQVKEKAFIYRKIIADCSEPKSIEEFRQSGINIEGAKKGSDSVRYGIKFLQGLEAIIIDADRCPHAFKEFTEYELIKDKNGDFKDEYPDKNNHIIDLVRYATEDISMPKAAGGSIGINDTWGAYGADRHAKGFI